MNGVARARLKLAWPALRAPLLLAVATVLCLAPFASAAFRIDDPIFLRSARWIQAHPADPFGAEMNWFGTEMPLWRITENPPGASYYIWLAARLVGWGETGLHLAFMLPAVLAVLGTFSLARRLCPQPMVAAAAALVSPVFWISSTTVMCDVPMLACWIWAVVLWRRGLDRRESFSLLLAAVLMAAAALTKYFGICVVPLLLAHTLIRERRADWRLAFLLLPLLALVALDRATFFRYGHGVVFGAGKYVAAVPRMASWSARGLATLAFTGGCFAPVLFFAPFLWSRKFLAAGAFLALTACLILGSIASPAGAPGEAGGAAGHWLAAGQTSLFALGGLGLLILAAAEWARCRDADSALLALWVGGTFLFAWLVNWMVSGRSLLPLAPAAAILIARRIGRHPGALSAPGRFFWPLAAAGLLSLGVVRADSILAGTARSAASEICRQYHMENRTIWFQGHWGFQYYMEAGGARPVDFKHPQIRRGEVMVVPGNNTGGRGFSREAFAPIGRIEERCCPWLTTMNVCAGAGFYSDAWGTLPFAFGTVPAEAYEIWQFRPPVRPSEY